jgi:hypothetical protein
VPTRLVLMKVNLITRAQTRGAGEANANDHTSERGSRLDTK